ncbi:MAG: endonuclease domain-containing protein [Thiobacillus sp.]|nr:endonuclease domain-containing protein [Thiobacillus sp.]
MKQHDFARQLRSKQTDAETLLWSRLRAHRLFGLKFRRQQPIGVYIVDFLCPEKKLIVELDGGQHQERADYDSNRDAWLESEGYVVLRYWNNEVMENLEGVLEDIGRVAGVFAEASPSPPAPLPSRERGEGISEHVAPPPRGGRGWGEGEGTL